MTSTFLHQTLTWMEDLKAAGWVGCLIVIVIYALACLVFVPGSVLAFGAGAVYGFWAGALVSSLANGLSAMLSFALTRWLLRNRVERYLARNPTVSALTAAAEREGWRIICLMHLSPIMPFALINYAFAMTTLSVWEFLAATVLGSIPSSCLYVYLGSLAGNFAMLGPVTGQHRPLQWLLQGLGLAATIGVTYYLTRVARSALKKRLPEKTA